MQEAQCGHLLLDSEHLSQRVRSNDDINVVVILILIRGILDAEGVSRHKFAGLNPTFQNAGEDVPLNKPVGAAFLLQVFLELGLVAFVLRLEADSAIVARTLALEELAPGEDFVLELLFPATAHFRVLTGLCIDVDSAIVGRDALTILSRRVHLVDDVEPHPELCPTVDRDIYLAIGPEPPHHFGAGEQIGLSRRRYKQSSEQQDHQQ
ncbi:MAG TPA: hypothetical protein VGE59_01835 [Patescibacteria group bacterium]